MRIIPVTCVAFALLFAACSNDDETGPVVGNGTVAASVDGTAFTSSLAVSAALQSGVLAIGASQTAGGSNVKQINITLTGVTATGTFTLGGSTTNFGSYAEATGTTTKVWTTALSGGTGTVTITQLTSTKAVGTFSFTAIPSTSTGATGNKSVTNGSFNVTIQ